MNDLRKAAGEALEALEDVPYMSNKDDYERLERVKTALRQALEEKQEPVAWMGIDIEGNPNKFRLNFFGGAIPLFVRNEDRTTIADNEKDGSPCPEFWDWLPRAYNFDGDGVFTKYNMEVAFLAGKQFADADDTSQERVDETVKCKHEPVAEIQAEDMGKPFNAIRVTVHFYAEVPAVGTKLYKAPPKREWVGLTDEEIDYQAKKDDHAVYFALGALWAEAKLKEKNT